MSNYFWCYLFLGSPVKQSSCTSSAWSTILGVIPLQIGVLPRSRRPKRYVRFLCYTRYSACGTALSSKPSWWIFFKDIHWRAIFFRELSSIIRTLLSILKPECHQKSKCSIRDFVSLKNHTTVDLTYRVIFYGMRMICLIRKSTRRPPTPGGRVATGTEFSSTVKPPVGLKIAYCLSMTLSSGHRKLSFRIAFYSVLQKSSVHSRKWASTSVRAKTPFFFSMALRIFSCCLIETSCLSRRNSTLAAW